MNRSRDSIIVEAALGTAYTGKTGTTPIVLPSSQKLVVNASGMTLDKLMAAKELFGINEIDEEDGEELFISMTSTQITNLLNDEKLTNQDYATVKALMKGEIDTFMGFTFVKSQRLNKIGTTRECFAWAKSGILLAQGTAPITEIDRLPGKRYSTQVYRSEGFGATRMEEEKVVQIDCLEA
jgi:hypothetical protein